MELKLILFVVWSTIKLGLLSLMWKSIGDIYGVFIFKADS